MTRNPPFFSLEFRTTRVRFRATKIAGGFAASRARFALTEVRGARVAGALARRALHANTQVNRRQGVCSTATLEAQARCRTSGRPPPRSPPGRETSVPDISRRTREGSRAGRSTWRTTPAPRWPLWLRATRNSGCVLSLVTRGSRAAAFPRGAPGARVSRARAGFAILFPLPKRAPFLRRPNPHRPRAYLDPNFHRIRRRSCVVATASCPSSPCTTTTTSATPPALARSST